MKRRQVKNQVKPDFFVQHTPAYTSSASSNALHLIHTL